MGPMKGYTFSKASGQAVGLTSMALALPVSFPSALPTVSLPFLPSPQTTATASLPTPAPPRDPSQAHSQHSCLQEGTHEHRDPAGTAPISS